RRARRDDKLVMGGIGRGLERNRHRRVFAAANDAEARRAPKRLGGKTIVESIRILDRLSVDRRDQVAGLEPAARRGAASRGAGDQGTAWPLETETFRDFRAHRLQPCAKPGPPYRGSSRAR